MSSIRRRGCSWQVQIRRVDCRPLSRSFRALKDAREWSRAMEAAADRQDLPHGASLLRSLTLAQLVVRYRDTVTVRKRTCGGETAVLNAFLRHPICRRTLIELRTADFATYRDERLRSLKPSSVSRELTPIRHMFELARKEWGLPIRINPLLDLSIDGSDHRRERRLKPGELQRLLRVAEQARNPLLPYLIQFAVTTGMRRGEMLAMQWTDFDRISKEVVIWTTKSGHPRIIPLPESAVAVLDEMPATDRLVFPMSGNAVRLAWERLRRRAAIENLHFHDLRHEAISCLFELGLSVPEVALISGHRDPRMLFRYTHPMREQIKAKLNERSQRPALDQERRSGEVLL